MARKKRKALIAGASGLVGSYLLDMLLQDDYYDEVVAIVRKPLDKEHPKLKQVEVQFKKLDDYASHFAVSHVFVCLGTTIKKAKSKKAFTQVDLEYPYKIALLAHQKGAKRFAVISSVGADRDSTFFYSRIKGKLEEQIAGIPFKSISIFRPSILLGPRKEFRFGEEMGKVANEIFKHFLIGKLSKYKGIKAEHVARSMLQVVKTHKKGFKVLESNDIKLLSKEEKKLQKELAPVN